MLWVSGPAGSGKTTLVSSYLFARKLPCLWYQLDERDGDLAQFFYYMGLAARQANPRKRRQLPLFTPEYMAGVPAFTRNYFEDLYSRLRPPFVMVLDNFQDAPEDMGFHEMIVHSLEVIPEGIKVMIVSRSEPPPQLAKVRAGHGFSFLGWKEIRFTLEETQAMYEAGHHDRPDSNIVEMLHRKSEGWAAGLVLFQEQMSRGHFGTALSNLSELSHKAVFDYLASEIFLKTEKEIQDFLLRTAFLPTMTSVMAEKLTENHRASQILAGMSRNHFFTERLSKSEQIYQYHPLFRDFLLARAMDYMFTPDETRSIQKRAAEILEESYAEDAAGLFISAEDWEGLIRVIATRAPEFLAQGRGNILQEWISCMPKDIVDRSPWLLFWMGTCRSIYNPAEGRIYLEKAFPLFDEKNDSAGVFLTWSGIVESFIFEWSGFKPLDHWIAVLEDFMARSAGFPSTEIEARVTGSMFLALTYRQPQHPDMPLWEKRLNAVLHTVSDDRQRIMMGTSLVHFYLWTTCNLPKVKLLIDSLKNISAIRNYDPMPLLLLRCLEETYLWSSGEFNECLQSVNDSLSIAKSSGVHFYDVGILAQGLYSNLTIGDMASRAEFLHRMKSVMNPARLLDAAHYHYLAGWEALIRNDIPTAMGHAQESVKLSEKAGSPFPQGICHIGLAHVLMSIRDYQAALPHIARGRSIGREMKSTYLEYTVLMTEARLALEQAKEEQCLDLLRQAFALGIKHGFLNHTMLLPAIMTRLCAKALEAGIEVEHVHVLIRKCKIIADFPPSEIEHWPWQLRIFTLGKFEVLIYGKKLEFTGKVQQKPLAMLKVLVALGGREVATEQVIDALWPEAEGDTAHISFKTTLHRLRQLVGCEQAIRLQEGHISLDERSCWIDAVAFQDLIEKSENGGHRDSSGTMRDPRQLRRKAIDLYGGDFLPGDGKEPWAIRMRERLKARAVRLFDAEGRSHEEAGAWGEAVECYEKALEANELYEEFYQRLMGCYQRQGKKAEALAVYHRCEKILSSVLGIEPSLRTRDIYKEIRR